jgi:galactokinase
MNTNKRRELADSKYNERRAECETAVSELQEKLDIQTLGELDLWTFDAYSYLIKDENRIKRARHAVLENQRTLQARKALESGDLEGFGRLMNASHVSLEHDYEVTGLELDTLAHTAWEQEGVLGARMTGAGFGGCAIALVNKDKVEDFKKAVGQRYEEVVGYAPSFYIAEVAGGSRVLD